eukprot:CAMPEP_0196651450 /NCGR_PEP_ID=MMETSP1086-20130531/397_1 /TAXON_ID=77921 /ORGANISM="Cyanoptyche  gloeocystis , Strain SAG4.97" /LENGTH=627 /DNA_ID=CAMNT_0041981449 /DNA_START=97 /DNA_END=1980 /DNA_ORIENTATION=+
MSLSRLAHRVADLPLKASRLGLNGSIRISSIHTRALRHNILKAASPAVLSAVKPLRPVAAIGLIRNNSNAASKDSGIKQKYDLGVVSLLPEWKEMLDPKGLKDDIVAGSTVAAVAVPLSLAIGLASGMNAVDGLNTAIVSGVICAFFGGSKLGISGPTAAMAAVVYNVIAHAGLAGLFYVTFIAGALQTLTGILGIGHLIRFMPTPIISAFAAGIAGLIAFGQITRATGLPAPPTPGVLSVLEHLTTNLSSVIPECLLITAITMGINQFLPKLSKKIPATLTAVAVSAALAFFGKLGVPLVTNIPTSLPPLHFPGLPDVSQMGFIMNSAGLVFAFASLESLLSGVAVDKIIKSKQHDPSQELIGQGLGNMATALVGAVPAAGVIVRSTLNASSGAKTRRSGLVQSAVVYGSIAGLNDLLHMIPIPTLAGVLLSVASKMVNPKDIVTMFKLSPVEGMIWLGTMLTIVLQDMMIGIQYGFAAELFYAFYQRRGTPLFRGFSHRVTLDPLWVYAHYGSDVKSAVLEVSGNLDFMAVFRLDDLKQDLLSPLYFANGQKGVLEVDLRKLNTADFSGLDGLAGILSDLIGQGVDVHFTKNPKSEKFGAKLVAADKTGRLKKALDFVPPEAVKK